MERRLDINLLPPEFLPQPAIRWHPIYLALLYTLSIFLVLYIGLACLNHIKRLEIDIEQAQVEIARLKPFADAYDKAEAPVKSMENMKRLFIYLERQYVDWPLFFHHLQPNMPKGIWLVQVESSAVTKSPITKKKAKRTGDDKAAGKASEPEVKGPPKHTGDVTLQGMVNGYSLLPLSTLIKNLQDDPYFTDPYLLDSDLQENEEGVVRWFEMSVRVKLPEEDDTDTGDKNSKPDVGNGGEAK